MPKTDRQVAEDAIYKTYGDKVRAARLEYERLCDLAKNERNDALAKLAVGMRGRERQGMALR